MRHIIVLLAVLGVALAPVVAEARGRGGAPVDRREKVKQKIRALRAYTLTEALALDEKTAAKLFPVLAKWDDVTDKLIVQRIDVQRRLEGADGLDGKAIDRAIDEAMANQRALVELEEHRLAELRKILTPAQTAKLLVVLPKFERRIRNQLTRAIQRAGNGGDARIRPRRGAIDDDGDDDDDDDERLPERTAPIRGTPRAPERPQQDCDPFNSVHGCPPAPRR